METVFAQDTEGCEQDTVELCSIRLPGTKAFISLPEGFLLMEEERKESYYPSENRPEVIWEKEETIQITLQTPDKELRPEETRSAAEQMSKLLKDTFPAYHNTPVYLLKEEEIAMGWFLLRMEQQGLEHIKAVCSIEKKMVLLTITYPEKDSHKWRILARYILSSLRQDAS